MLQFAYLTTLQTILKTVYENKQGPEVHYPLGSKRPGYDPLFRNLNSSGLTTL